MYLIDQVAHILKHAAPGTMLASLKIMYSGIPEDIDVLTALNMFVEGLKDTGFFTYTDFLKQLHG
jgi:hypothetical protein